MSKSIRCQEAELAIMENLEDPRVQEHIKTCLSCSEFARFHDDLMNVEETDCESPSLESILLRRAAQNQSPRPAWWVATGIAAMFAAVLWIAAPAPPKIDNVEGVNAVIAAVDAEDDNQAGESLELSWDNSETALALMSLQDELESYYNSEWKIETINTIAME